MSRTISSEKLNALSHLKLKGSIAACLIGIGLSRGYELKKIAEIAGVSRAALHSWINGATARKNNLAQLIIGLNIQESELNSIYSAPDTNNRSFDSKSLTESIAYEVQKKELAELIKIVAELKEHSNNSIFTAPLYRNHGKALIEASLNMPDGGRPYYKKIANKTELEEVTQGYGDELIIVFPYAPGSSWTMLDKQDLISLQKILLHILKRRGYEADYLDENCEDKQSIIRAIERESIVILEIQYFCELYDEILSLVSKLLPNAVLAFGSEYPSSKNSVPICDLWWETSKYKEDIKCQFDQNGCGEIEGELLLTWLNDVDGKKIMNILRDKIKQHMLENKKYLTLFAHQGRFVEVGDFDFDHLSKNGTARLLYRTMLESCPAGTSSHRLNNFQYGDDQYLEDLETAIPSIWELEPSRLYIENREFPFTFRAFEFLFTSLGFTTTITIDNPAQWIHKIKISW